MSEAKKLAADALSSGCFFCSP